MVLAALQSILAGIRAEIIRVLLLRSESVHPMLDGIVFTKLAFPTFGPGILT